MIELAWQAMTGIGLAASAGLRAFLPLLVVGAAARAGVLELAPRFAWLQSNAALTVLAVAVVAELLGDKIPAVDHLLDVAGTLLRPLAGALVAAASLTALDPVAAMALGAAVGVPVASGVHAAKACARVVSTGTTGGLGTPLLSVAEDGVSLGASLVSLLLPVVTSTLALGCLYLLARRGWRTPDGGVASELEVRAAGRHSQGRAR